MIGSHPVMPLGRRTSQEAERATVLENTQAQSVEPPGIRTSSARGALTGILMGVGIWAAIIAGVVAILKQ